MTSLRDIVVFRFTALFIVTLSGCGGGSSSSGVGSAHEGAYSGTLFLRATGRGGTVSTSTPLVIVIESDGRVLAGIQAVNQGAGSSAPVANQQIVNRLTCRVILLAVRVFLLARFLRLGSVQPRQQLMDQSVEIPLRVQGR